MAGDDAKEAAPAGMAPWRLRARAFVEQPAFQNAILWLIVVNAVTLGLETSPTAMATAGPLLLAIDRAILAVFVVEIALRLAGYGWRFFRDPWSIFDFVVVAIALIPASGQFSVLRSLRILRALRLISTVPRMRRVVTALLSAIPGLGAIIALLSLIFYVSAVMATKLFGASFPDWFGTIGESLYSLFQVMTLESWSMGIVRPVLEVYSLAWLFFVPFILITTFTTLNLFIAVIVNAMQAEHDREAEAAEAEAKGERGALLEELQAVRRELAELRADLGRGATGA